MNCSATKKAPLPAPPRRNPVLIDAARGGTLFLDEVGDIPLPMQVKLLRLIETGAYRPVGSITPKQADFRLICATHRQLEDMVAAGTFRQDLYYRISPFPVLLPSLRERPEDIVPLATHLLQQLSPQRPLQFSDSACDWLTSQTFPGNIRELRNRIERAILLCDSNLIEARHLQLPQRDNLIVTSSTTLPTSLPVMPLDQLEQHYLQQLQQQYEGDNASLAQALGISERTLYRKLRSLRSQKVDNQAF